MMQLIDSHCHIQSISSHHHSATDELWRSSNLNADQVLDRAVAAGVTKFVCVGCDIEDSQLAVAFVANRHNCVASVGIHPHEAARYSNLIKTKMSFETLLKRSQANKIVAIGECGLDYFYHHSPQDDQKAILKLQLDLASSYNLPVIFHVRDAFADFWPIFDQYKGSIRGVLHSFTDNPQNLQKALDRHLLIGVNGIATFMKQAEQLDMIKSIPINSLILETDSPYLTPVPYRGTVNEPKHTRTILDFLSNLRGETAESLAKATTFNANLLFGL